MSCSQVRFHKTESGLNGEFRIKDINRLSIYISTDGYVEHPAVRDGNVWKVELPYTAKFKAFMTADGEYFLPDCPMREYDDFGSQLCLYEEE